MLVRCSECNSVRLHTACVRGLPSVFCGNRMGSYMAEQLVVRAHLVCPSCCHTTDIVKHVVPAGHSRRAFTSRTIFRGRHLGLSQDFHDQVAAALVSATAAIRTARLSAEDSNSALVLRDTRIKMWVELPALRRASFSLPRDIAAAIETEIAPDPVVAPLCPVNDEFSDEEEARTP